MIKFILKHLVNSLRGKYDKVIKIDSHLISYRKDCDKLCLKFLAFVNGNNNKFRFYFRNSEYKIPIRKNKDKILKFDFKKEVREAILSNIYS